MDCPYTLLFFKLSPCNQSSLSSCQCLGGHLYHVLKLDLFCISNSRSRDEGLIRCIHDPFFFSQSTALLISKFVLNKNPQIILSVATEQKPCTQRPESSVPLRVDGEEDEVKILFGIPVCLKFFNPYFNLMSKFMANQRLY